MVFCNLAINFQKNGEIANLSTREIKHLRGVSSQTWKKSLVEEVHCFLTAITPEFSQISPLHCPQAATHDLQLHLMNFITSAGGTSLSV